VKIFLCLFFVILQNQTKNFNFKVISKNLKNIHLQLPDNVQIVCVSKFHSEEMIMEAYNMGERNFGESRAQELFKKQANLPKDIRWHFIGPLQSNKIRQIIPFICLIHSVESEKLLQEISHCAEKINRKIGVLLEVHIACEEQKHGFSENEIINFFKNKKWQNFPNINFCGLMGIATYTSDNEQIKAEFSKIKKLFDTIKNIFDNENFTTLSIGMSDDFMLAVKQGSTLVRIGSKIFGSRQSI
jgi:pyridoxal phosphate enzyme (YggS family)